MKKLWRVARALVGLAILAALAFVLVVAFRSVSSGTGAAPIATQASSQEALAASATPAQNLSGYPGSLSTRRPAKTPNGERWPLVGGCGQG